MINENLEDMGIPFSMISTISNIVVDYIFLDSQLVAERIKVLKLLILKDLQPF